ncbi:MAG: clostripain-related cysteine peptidase [Bellilinea sp.]
MSNSPEVNVKRRRKGEKPTQQAGAPVRRRGAGGVTSGGSRSGLGGSGGLLTPTRGKVGGCGGLIGIILIIVLYIIFTGGGGLDTGPVEVAPPSTFEEPTAIVATATPRPTRAPSTSGSGETWTVMLYQDADDQVLEQDIYLDLNEAEKVGSSDKVAIVTQMDRFRGGFAGNDDWHSARRYLVTQDNDLNNIGSELLADLGEVNMADGQTLVDFVTWAMQNYPADRYALILSDHGLGWPGGWSDPAPGGVDPGKAPLIGALQGDSIYLSELESALSQIQSTTGVEKLDLIGMDACLMSQMEVYAMLQPYAKFAVASEEVEPGLGWAYAAFLDELVANPSMDGATLATNIVDTYIAQDQRIVDTQARADFLRQGSTMGGFFGVPSISAAQLTDQIERNITLTAVDLDAYADLITSFNTFIYAMQDVDQRAVASARNYTQSYTSIFGKEVPPSYIDLGHFVQLVVRQTGDAALQSHAQDVLNALNNAIVAERHGQSKPGSTGIALYFPNSTLYRSPYTGMQSYTMLAERFSRVTLWDDFLVYHYNDRSFKADAVEPVVPSTSGITRAPGAGAIAISAIQASANSVSPGGSIQMSAEITGENVGYVYLFTGFYDSGSNSIYVADTDYLESPDTRELNGVYYPAWPEGGSFRLNFDWEPILFSITDGSQSILALFNPGAYGASAEDATYMVQGTFTFADTGEQRTAQLYFKDGKLFQVVGFTGEDTASAPREITPSMGDTFTIAQKWMELDSSGSVTQVVYEDGDTLTFGAAPFEWEQVYAPDGQYLVGFLVGDLDGNMNEAYTQVTVR